MSRKSITVWERARTEHGRYEFNHIESGWSRLAAPCRGYTDEQVASWMNYSWRKTFAFLEDGHVKVSDAQDYILRAAENGGFA